MDIRDIYERFLKNHRTDNGGVNLYPEFDFDLACILKFTDDVLNFRDICSDKDINYN